MALKRPHRLEISELEVPESSEHWTNACRVVRMYQEQACNLDASLQACYIYAVLDLQWYKVEGPAETDLKSHDAWERFLDLVVDRKELAQSAWLILHALYGERVLEEIAASEVEMGSKPEIGPSRYDEYRQSWPLEGQLPSLDTLRSGQSQVEQGPVAQDADDYLAEESDDESYAPDYKNDASFDIDADTDVSTCEEDDDSASDSDEPASESDDDASSSDSHTTSSEVQTAEPESHAAESTTTVSRLNPLFTPQSSSGSSSVAGENVLPENASALAYRSKNGKAFDNLCDRMASDGEVLRFFVQQIQKLQRENEALATENQDLKGRMAASS